MEDTYIRDVLEIEKDKDEEEADRPNDWEAWRRDWENSDE